jgi:tripartite-type tricarboxylate transporter receptor subunit TctC
VGDKRILSRRMFLAFGVALPVFFDVPAALAQSWPQRPGKILVPFAAGGNTDSIARLIGQWLSQRTGQQFVVENRPGANGTIAAEAVARSTADGYTLFMAALPQIAIFPAMTKVPYDPVKDFMPISNIGSNPFALIVNPDLPTKTLQEFVAYVRAQKENVPYASGGTGSLSHLSMVLLLKRAGLEMTHIPYKGGGPAVADIIAGHVNIYFANLSEALPQAKAGNVRVIAVSSEQRTPQLPDVPTVAEQGYPGFRTVTWNGLMAPAGTPPDIISRVATEVGAAVKDPTIKERLGTYGVDPVGDEPDHFAETIKADIIMWSQAIKLAGVTMQQ